METKQGGGKTIIRMDFQEMNCARIERISAAAVLYYLW